MTKQYQPLTHTGPGTQSVTFGWEDIIKGASSTKDIADGGLSPESTAINLYLNRGKVSSSPLPTNITSNLPGSFHGFAATCPSSETGGNPANYLKAVDFLGDLYNYAANGTWTQPGFDSAGNVYDSIHSDMCFFNGSYYVSTANTSLTSVTNDNVIQWNGISTVVSDWFHTNFKVGGTGQYLKISTIHSMIVFNKSLYIADGNLLHKYDGTNFVYAVLTLSSEANITALAIDPQSGRLMVAFTTSDGFNGTTAISKIGLYDGTNPNQFIKLCVVDDVVFCLYPIGGQVYVFYGSNFGVWNGNGITFIRDNLNTGAGYKQRVTSIGNDLYYNDGGSITCYSEVIGGGQKSFSNINTDTDITNAVDSLFYLDSGNKYLGYSVNTSGTYNLKSFAIRGSGSLSSTTVLYSNHYYFPRQMYIRAIDVLLDATPASGETVTPIIIDDNGTNNTTNPTQMTNASLRTTRFSVSAKPTTSFKLKLSMATASSLKRVIIYYDAAE